MKIKKKQKIILFFLFLLFLLGANLASALEIRYPNLPGVDPPQIFIKSAPIEQHFSLYVKYFLTLITWASGIIALVALIYGGIRYLTSTGKPVELEKARKQILAVLFGIIILLSSYLILRTINPELIDLSITKLKEIIFSPLQYTPETKAPQLFGKIKEIAEGVKVSSESIKNTAEKIQELTDECSCKNTQSLCACTGGSDSSDCQPIRCYAGPTQHDDDFHPEADAGHHHPCPDFVEIENNQQRIIAWKDEILYYRNRAWDEKEDLEEEIREVLDKQIAYCDQKIGTETDDNVIQYFEDKKRELEQEKQYKDDLVKELAKLIDLIDQIDFPSLELGSLPDRCLINVGQLDKDGKPDICKPKCKGECHDFLEGCQPDKCDGENPCPTKEIEDQVDEIGTLHPNIIQACNEILTIIDDIIIFETITI